jgi:hypothetical protein
MKSLKIIEGFDLADTNALYPSDVIYSGALVADTEQTVTVPTDAEFVIFMCNNDFYINYDTTAAVPTGSISEAGGELNPEVRYIGETTVLHIISEFACKITLAFYKK